MTTRPRPGRPPSRTGLYGQAAQEGPLAIVPATEMSPGDAFAPTKCADFLCVDYECAIVGADSPASHRKRIGQRWEMTIKPAAMPVRVKECGEKRMQGPQTGARRTRIDRPVIVQSTHGTNGAAS